MYINLYVGVKLIDMTHAVQSILD